MWLENSLKVNTVYTNTYLYSAFLWDNLKYDVSKKHRAWTTFWRFPSHLPVLNVFIHLTNLKTRTLFFFQVRAMIKECTCPDQFPMVRVSEGKYKIGDSQTLIFVRVSLATSDYCSSSLLRENRLALAVLLHYERSVQQEFIRE